jgi:hypothetical protein
MGMLPPLDGAPVGEVTCDGGIDEDDAPPEPFPTEMTPPPLALDPATDPATDPPVPPPTVVTVPSAAAVQFNID